MHLNLCSPITGIILVQSPRFENIDRVVIGLLGEN